MDAETKGDKILDVRGSPCPGPLLAAKKAMGSVPVGGVLEIWSDDVGTKQDIPLWARKVGHQYVGAIVSDGYERILVKRGR